ncbi:S41 family peptidase [Pedobacter foliorum]|uniref:S41 family peptidase n=1 Tax=Pedobacter foliorum TaxID=2739058 RepID=UPI001564A3C7|nr:S41 family peptidase [Pedobacter foliorum]NRF39687.1 peptidase S41 [Pedobacter foliorum]
MKANLMLFFISLVLLSCAQKTAYNLDAEKLDSTGRIPEGWDFSFEDQGNLGYSVQLDTVVKQSGKHSISIQKLSNQSTYRAIDYVISKMFTGKSIQLKGYIKTEIVDSGHASLWIRIDDKDGGVAFKSMGKESLSGTKGWKEYSITLPYDSEVARKIHIGGLLVGKGKAWFDSFQLFIDGKAISEVPIKQVVLAKGELDTAFSKSSGITAFKTNPQIINNLMLAGQFWGFLKYYHPSIAKGDYNWDAELFRFLPQVIKAPNNVELSNVLESHFDKLAKPTLKENKQEIDTKTVAIKPDYGQLFNGSVLSKSLTDKLLSVKNNGNISTHYYISFMPGIGNPKFQNEKSYRNMVYPDAGYRILSLYRYWAMINYFFPYKDVIGTNWNKVLSTSIPDFVDAKDKYAYVLATLKVIAKINDTHANIWNNNQGLNIFKGQYKLPFKAEFIENKLIVTGYYADTLGVKQKFLIGDVISSINGKPLEQMIKEFLPYTPASNYDTQLRDLPWGFLLRGNMELFTIGLNRAGKKITETSKGIDAFYNTKPDPSIEEPGFKLLNNDLGYLFPGKFKISDLPAIKKLFENTKGIIVDMRCYPSEFMVYPLSNYIKPFSTPFVKFTKGVLSQPGLFIYGTPIESGSRTTYDAYTGKVVVIVNSTSQSQAEFTTMALQSSPNVKVIGSTTAGADGDVSTIVLPGGISTWISGIGVFYPDGTPTQRVGVKIDHFLKPTIKGTIEGRDELLEKAKEILKNSTK